MRRIEPRPLWLGHAGDARDARRLFDCGIRVVVQLAVEEPVAAVPRELVLLRFPLIDGGGNEAALLRVVIDAIAGLIREGVPTLVCCGAGMSRSPAVVAAALSRLGGREPGDCLREVASGGPADVSPALWKELCDVLEQSGHEQPR